MAFRLQFAQNLGGELQVAHLVILRRPLNSRTDPRRIEDLDRFVPHRLLQRLAELPRAGIAVPRLLRHCFVHRLAQGGVHLRTQFRGWRRREIQDRVHHRLLGWSLEGPAPRQRLITHDSQRKNVRQGRDRLHLDLFRRHVKQRPFHAARAGRGVHPVRYAEVDDLRRIVFQHENVARLDIPVNQPALVRRL